MMRTRLIVLTLAMTLLQSVVATGAIHKLYVSPTGSDANDGKTPETAWKTLDKINTV